MSQSFPASGPVPPTTGVGRGRQAVGRPETDVPWWVLAMLGTVPLLAALLALLLSAPAASATHLTGPVPGTSGVLAVSSQAASVTDLACSAQEDASACDADGDAIPDAVEVVVCGSATCATGREDTDTDGIPDWTEVTACGSLSCADPALDTDSDGVPDYAEVLACGSVTCSNGRDDTDGNGIADWIDYVICGTAGCATGQEDFDGNGVSDAAELAACVKDQPTILGIAVPGTAGPGSTGFLASTGFQAGLIALAAVLLLGSGAFLIYARKKKTTTGDEPGDGGNPDTGDDIADEVRSWV